MKRVKQNSTILTEGRSDLLASCLVVTSAFVLSFSWTAIVAEAFPWLFLVLGIYGLTLWGSILLFTGRNKSIEFLRLMTLIGVIEAAGSLFLLWAVFTFQI